MLKSKGPPFQFFWHCETFFQKFVFTKGSPFIFLMICVRIYGKSQRPPLRANPVQLLGFWGAVDENTLTL